MFIVLHISFDTSFLCRNPCSFSQASVVGDTVFVADGSGSAVHVIDIKTQKKIETIPTDPYPYGLHSLPWRKEVWVHSWNLSTFDVIETEGRNRTHKAIRAHVKPGQHVQLALSNKEKLSFTITYVNSCSWYCNFMAIRAFALPPPQALLAVCSIVWLRVYI